MDFNNIVFPSPKFFYSSLDEYQNELIYIPKESKNENDINFIPCLFLKEMNKKTKNFLLFFHGNAEDIFGAKLMADKLKTSLCINIIIMEYPGYSLYNSEKSSDTILENSIIVYDKIKEIFKLSDKNIFILGRSIGTSPAIYLSSQRKPNALFLISAFTSIKAVANNLVGFLNILIKERFISSDYIKDVTCPILLIHGQSDPLIPFTETLKLKDNCNCPYEVLLPKFMTHNDFDLDDDIINPIIDFMIRHCFIDKETCEFDLTDDNIKNLFNTPEEVRKKIMSEF